jgi:hypothetical protein
MVLMTWRSKVWWVLVVLYVVVNAGGAAFAAAEGEPLHAGLHVGLLIGAYLIWLARRPDGRTFWNGERSYPAPQHELSDRLMRLEQSLDAVAIEIERIGEGQRFMTHFYAGYGTAHAPGEVRAEPKENRGRDAAPE